MRVQLAIALVGTGLAFTLMGWLAAIAPLLIIAGAFLSAVELEERLNTRDARLPDRRTPVVRKLA